MASTQRPPNGPTPLDRYRLDLSDEEYLAQFDPELKELIETTEISDLWGESAWSRPLEDFEPGLQRGFANIPVRERNLKMITVLSELTIIALMVEGFYGGPKYKGVRILAKHRWQAMKEAHAKQGVDLWNYVDPVYGERVFYDDLLWATMEGDGAGSYIRGIAECG